ncbi:oligoendopeptidase F [Lysinibacillus sp. 2017]|uniref:oligoendopeptidase F n=1 Tax=unclassified Lysinibacillus TaxID=2636778 RepID=UPI000D527510|nr:MULTISPECIES: oligoendopeptidase F [unclassified Lysinibacillus]AWE07053.1 oligoendopeptidase F [Lysinibacillus sp. 2017]TGN37025.1 oligoendopeptidase F [Lysinibacillus sp. S2017]
MSSINRNEVPVQETWNLGDLFPSEEAYLAAIEGLKEEVNAAVDQLTGTITDARGVVKAIETTEKIQLKMVPIGTYASLSHSVDQTSTENQMRSAQFGSVAATLATKLSFVKSDLLALDESVLKEAQQLKPEYANYIEKLLIQKPYQLHPEAEKALAAFGATLDAPYELYNTTKLVDMKFPNFEVNGETFPMSYNLFEGDWELETDTDKRRAAFDAFSNKLRDYQHTTAKAYNTHLNIEKTDADLRGYSSIYDALLESQQVDRTLYDRQIDLIMNELAPHMRRYAKLLQKTHGLDKMTFADLKVSLDPSYEPTITVEESRQYMKDGLAVMGEDYSKMLDRAFEERWIDFAQNAGKSTGAFCSSPYGVHPYVLISWTSRMNEVFVLAHELGHAGHFYLANDAQNIFNARPSLYFIEAPSTMNEMLMANYLLKNSNDTQFKRWVISTIISRTYYHNFVTHLLEAAYQRKVYDIIDAGGNVNAPKLNELKREVLEQFWGDTVEINEGAELTWMRQPHYYMGLYPYTYSAGLTISTQVSQRILNGDESAVAEWTEVLKTGGTKTPVELAKMAGLDITTEKPLRDTIAFIGDLITQLEQLTKELENA